MTGPGAVLVHGLWHGAWCWDAVRGLLDERGVDSVAVELPLTDLGGRLRRVHRTVFRGVPAAVAWQTVPSTYVVCTADEVIHPERQRAMARQATRAVEWPCGHSPAATRPQALAALIAERVGAVPG